MLRRFRADLHVHTCLSPCADLRMSPRAIVERVCAQKIEILGICDHNSAGNVPALQKAARTRGVTVLPGIEVCTREEIHVLALFGDIAPALALQSVVYDHLSGKNDPEAFGMQVLANDQDEVLAFEERLLIGAVDLPVEEIVGEIHRLGGAAIAAHIDRESYSVISQLGFIPPGLKFDALELSRFTATDEARIRFPEQSACTILRNSDAHFPEDIGRNTCEYLLEGPTFPEIMKAFRNEGGRMVCEG
jgi:PHP family Zn ribbon phosphoesterase